MLAENLHPGIFDSGYRDGDFIIYSMGVILMTDNVKSAVKDGYGAVARSGLGSEYVDFAEMLAENLHPGVVDSGYRDRDLYYQTGVFLNDG